MSETQERTLPPTSGCLVDLSKEERQALAGAMINVFSNAKGATGLLVKIEDGIAFLYRHGESEFLRYPVGSTSFERVPGKPILPALASALDTDDEWEQQRDELLNEDGDAKDQRAYDDAQASHEMDLGQHIHDDLLSEMAKLVFGGFDTAAPASVTAS
jgi:hypothetical protein